MILVVLNMGKTANESIDVFDLIYSIFIYRFGSAIIHVKRRKRYASYLATKNKTHPLGFASDILHVIIIIVLNLFFLFF